MENKADLIGWVGTGFFAAGAILIAYHSIWGFIFNAFGNACYVVQGIWSGLPSLYLLSCGLIVLNLFGIYKWST